MVIPMLSFIQYLICAGLVFIITACSSDTNEYRQPKLPPEYVAQLRLRHLVGHDGPDLLAVKVVRIDDHAPPWARSVTISPGPHSLELAYGLILYPPPVLSWTQDFEAVAGHTYQFQSFQDGNALRFWLEEMETGRVLGMQSLRYQIAPEGWESLGQVTPLPKLRIAGGDSSTVIAIRTTSVEQGNSWREPRKGAGEGALSGSGQALEGFSEACGMLLQLSVFCIPMLPVVALGGAVGGALVGHSEEEVLETTATLKNALQAALPDQGVELGLIDELQNMGGGRYKVRQLTKSQAKASHKDLAGQGIDAVFELQETRLDLVISGGEIEPNVALNLSVRATIVTTTDGAKSPTWMWNVRGAPHNYFDFAANDALLLRRSADTAYSEVAQLIVTDLLSGPFDLAASHERNGHVSHATARAQAPSGGTSATTDVTLERAMGISQRIEASVENDTTAFLRKGKEIPLDWRNLELIDWELTSISGETFIVGLFYRYRVAGSSGHAFNKFVLSGRIEGDKVTYLEVLESDRRSVQ